MLSVYQRWPPTPAQPLLLGNAFIGFSPNRHFAVIFQISLKWTHVKDASQIQIALILSLLRVFKGPLCFIFPRSIMKDKPNGFTQGRATGPTGKPDKNMSIHRDCLDEETQGALKDKFLKFVWAAGCRCVSVCVWRCMLCGWCWNLRHHLWGMKHPAERAFQMSSHIMLPRSECGNYDCHEEVGAQSR